MLKSKGHKQSSQSRSRNKRILTAYSSLKVSLFNSQHHKSTGEPSKKHPRALPKGGHRAGIQKQKNKKKGHLQQERLDFQEQYERIPMFYLHSNTNSEIDFSNCAETKPQLKRKPRKMLYIDCGEDSLAREVWSEDYNQSQQSRRQIQSATLIQKVFRGYLTRKMLQKYIKQEEEQLHAKQKYFREQLLGRSGIKNSAFRNEYRCLQDEEQDVQLSSRIELLGLSYFPSPKKAHKQSENGDPRLLEGDVLDLQSSISSNENEEQSSLYPGKQEYNQQKLARDKQTIEQNRFLSKKRQKTFAESDLSFLNSEPQERSLFLNQQCKQSPKFVNHSTQDNMTQDSPERANKKSNLQQQMVSNDSCQTELEEKTFFGNMVTQISQDRTKLASITTGQYSSSRKKTFPQNEEGNLQSLRKQEREKWEQVISILSQQLSDEGKQDSKQLINSILEISMRNRQQLFQEFQPHQGRDSMASCGANDPATQHQQILISFKKKISTQQCKSMEQVNEEKVRKNENMPLLRKQISEKSLLQRTINLRQHFLTRLQMQDEHLQKMMEFCETALKNKEASSLCQLRQKLEHNEITHDQFIECLSYLTKSFQKEKEGIDRTRKEIYQGYRAQLQLVKMTVIEARTMGYKISFCRSMELFPGECKWRFDELLIDQLAQRRILKQQPQIVDSLFSAQEEVINQEQGSMKIAHSQVESLIVIDSQLCLEQQAKDSLSESINFNYEEDYVYKKSLPYSFDVSSFEESNLYECDERHHEEDSRELPVLVNNRQSRQLTMTLEQDFSCNSPPIDSLYQQEPKDNSHFELRRQIYQLSCDDSSEEETLYRKPDDKVIAQLLAEVTEILLWETVQEIYRRPIIALKIIPETNEGGLDTIEATARLAFLEVVQSSLPLFQNLTEQINQKLYPTTKELLLSMRQQSSFCHESETEENSYFEIGHFEYLLSQTICAQAMETYLETYERQKQVSKQRYDKQQRIIWEYFQRRIFQYFSPNFIKFINNRRKNILTKRQQNEELRTQIMKIELHVILDSWNDQLIHYRQNHGGYSGIGLNEISLAMKQRKCVPITNEQQFRNMIKETKEKMKSLVIGSGQKGFLFKEWLEMVCDDALWVMYANEALDYGFDLAKAVEIELIVEAIEDINSANDIKTVTSPREGIQTKSQIGEKAATINISGALLGEITQQISPGRQQQESAELSQSFSTGNMSIHLSDYEGSEDLDDAS